jgi:hypothetical protein
VTADEPAAHAAKTSHAHSHKEKPAEATASPADTEPESTVAPGSYGQGVLPPVFSPFAKPADVTPEAPAAEPEKPARAHHSSKKAASESQETPETQA